MNINKLPDILPEYTIIKTDKPPFECIWEEIMGWLIIPRINEKLSWAMYEMPGRKRSEMHTLRVVGRASVHGISGVEIHDEEQLGEKSLGNRVGTKDEFRRINRTLIAQLTDTHCRILAESHMQGDVKYYFTFLDGDSFLNNWGFGEDNCGNDIRPKQTGIIKRAGQTITCPVEKFVLDVTDRCTIMLGGKEYDTIRIMDVECYDHGTVSEQYLDQNGRTVLWRRFNRDDWRYDYYKQKWSDKLPDNERLIVNEETYVHWYDCISDYIL